METDNR